MCPQLACRAAGMSSSSFVHSLVPAPQAWSSVRAEGGRLGASGGCSGMTLTGAREPKPVLEGGVEQKRGSCHLRDSWFQVVLGLACSPHVRLTRQQHMLLLFVIKFLSSAAPFKILKFLES